MNAYTLAAVFIVSLILLVGVAVWVTGSAWPMLALWLLTGLKVGGDPDE